MSNSGYDDGRGTDYASAAHQALTAFGITPANIRFVHLSENVTFKVIDARDESPLVLRLHRPWYHTIDELRSERLWTRALARAGVAAPEPLLALNGEDFVEIEVAATGERRWCGLARWVDGEMLADVVARETETAAKECHFARLGATIAMMHDQATGWTLPTGFRRHAVDADGLMGPTPFWGPFWDHGILSPAERACCWRRATRCTAR